MYSVILRHTSHFYFHSYFISNWKIYNFLFSRFQWWIFKKIFVFGYFIACSAHNKIFWFNVVCVFLFFLDFEFVLSCHRNKKRLFWILYAVCLVPYAAEYKSTLTTEILLSAYTNWKCLHTHTVENTNNNVEPTYSNQPSTTHTHRRTDGRTGVQTASQPAAQTHTDTSYTSVQLKSRSAHLQHLE